MKNPFQSAPRCVQWAAAILIALPVFETVVALGIMPAAQLMEQWQTRFSSTAVFLIIALGVVLGSNSIRLIFAALTIFNSLLGLVSFVVFSGPSIGTVHQYVSLVAPCVALVLCCLPEANAYFKPQKDSAPSPESPSVELTKSANSGRNLKIAIGTVAVAGLLAVALAYRTHRNETKFHAMEIEAFLPGQVRYVAQGASQYFLEYPEATSVPFGVDANGTVTGPLHNFYSHVIKGVRVVGDKIDRSEGTITLQHDDAFGGKPVVFNSNGEIVSPRVP